MRGGLPAILISAGPALDEAPMRSRGGRRVR
jgi:hypothetical protein